MYRVYIKDKWYQLFSKWRFR